MGAAEEPGFLDVENTPERVARMLRDEVLSSYRPEAMRDLLASFRTFPTGGAQDLVAMGPISFHSSCAHHMIPFFGEAFVGYVPTNRLVGLSKIPRVVRHFSRKLQTQERLTGEIADFLETNLEPRGLIVVVRARHLCMEARGVMAPGVITRTSTVRGIAKTSASTREEFYTLLRVDG